MTLIIDNKLVILVTLLVVTVTGVAVAADCEYIYFYASIKNRENYKTEQVRGMIMTVYNASIYDLPNLPSSWVYKITKTKYYDRMISHLSAVAKSDKHIIKYRDLENFVILRQPKTDKIHIKLTVLEMTEKTTTRVKAFETEDFTVQMIDKCLPKKQRRH
ncbi:MAG: hypothetical protein H7843_04800 [Nitrospirota bacterium]